MKIFALDAHPGVEGLSKELLTAYLKGASTTGAEIEKMALRDMTFDPILHEGYRKRQGWEPDLERAVAAIMACDHFVLAHPMWWGGQPAQLKGFLDRAFLPGVAFKYKEGNPMPEGLLKGRSATVLITGDTPGFILKYLYGNPIVRQTSTQILTFCGLKPNKIHYWGPVRKQKDSVLSNWLAQAEKRGAREAAR